jgi:hypothetical protein
MKKIPNPGSDEAIKKGCICPALDNEHGADWFGKTHGFFVIERCPLHHNKNYLKGNKKLKH